MKDFFNGESSPAKLFQVSTKNIIIKLRNCSISEFLWQNNFDENSAVLTFGALAFEKNPDILVFLVVEKLSTAT